MQLFVVPRSIPSTFAIIFFSTFFRPPWATQDLSKDRAKRLEIAQNPNFQGKYVVTHDTPATLIVTICRIFADLFMLAFHRAACFAATVLTHEKWPIRASLQPLVVYIYAVGSQSCATRLIFVGSAPLSAYPPSEASRRRRCPCRGAKQAAQCILGNWANGTCARHSLRGKARLLPRAASTVRSAILRRRDTASSSRARPVAHHANCRRTVPLRSLLTHAPLARPSAMARFSS